MYEDKNVTSSPCTGWYPIVAFRQCRIALGRPDRSDKLKRHMKSTGGFKGTGNILAITYYVRSLSDFSGQTWWAKAAGSDLALFSSIPTWVSEIIREEINVR